MATVAGGGGPAKKKMAGDSKTTVKTSVRSQKIGGGKVTTTSRPKSVTRTTTRAVRVPNPGVPSGPPAPKPYTGKRRPK